jgi:hypothetical protein
MDSQLNQLQKYFYIVELGRSVSLHPKKYEPTTKHPRICSTFAHPGGIYFYSNSLFLEPTREWPTFQPSQIFPNSSDNSCPYLVFDIILPGGDGLKLDLKYISYEMGV